MVTDSGFSRRRVLAAVGGIAGTVGVGYAGARSVSREGVVNGRLVTGYDVENGTIVGQTEILWEFIDTDGPTNRRIHRNYREAFPAEPPMTVSWSLHRTLSREFDDVGYNLSHACPDADCSTPGVSRRDFNGARLGENVRLLYHPGSNATVIP